MKEQKKKSSIPPYGVAALWIWRALSGNLSDLWQIIKCVAVSCVLYLVLKLIFPDKVVKAEEAKKEEPKAQPQPEPQPQPQPQPEPAAEESELEQVLRQGREAVEEIRRLNDEIPDFKVSAQMKQLELLTEKIFAFVEKNPRDLKEIRKFMSYYLPTTIKLLRQYEQLDKQGMRMGNIDEGMKKIEDMLDKIIVAFQKQLDSLFERDVVDLTADIQVMEQMMAAEGLTDQKDF